MRDTRGHSCVEPRGGEGCPPHVVEAALVPPHVIGEVRLQVVGAGQGEGDAQLQAREGISIFRQLCAIGRNPWASSIGPPSAAPLCLQSTGLAQLSSVAILQLPADHRPKGLGLHLSTHLEFQQSSVTMLTGSSGSQRWGETCT